MSQHYSSPERAADKYSLPDIEVFELTAEETAEQDEDMLHEYMRKHEFRLASMNRATRDKMVAAMIEDNSIVGGFFWWCCFPGCMPEGPAIGPFKTREEALQDAINSAAE
jgi:hypothetical protein